MNMIDIISQVNKTCSLSDQSPSPVIRMAREVATHNFTNLSVKQKWNLKSDLVHALLLERL
jgi:hypothetical protein